MAATNYLGQPINPATRPDAQANSYMPPAAPGANAPVQGLDMAKIFAMMVQAQQQQQQGQLAQQQDFFTQTNPLGATAAANSRPGGLTPGSQWSSMFGDNAASALTPEARMATQGRSAQNQWAQMGQVPGVDPTQLQSLMGQMTPTPSPYTATPDSTISDPYFAPRMQKMFGERTDLPKPVGSGIAPFQSRSTLPPGTVAGDGTTNYKRKGSSFGMEATGSPKPGFEFKSSKPKLKTMKGAYRPGWSNLPPGSRVA